MFTFLKFTPLDPTYAPFTFVLHPHLRRPNIVDDALLNLDFFMDDEACVALFDGGPVISATRLDQGLYLNHQLLRKSLTPLRDGDVLAIPRHRHNLKTAVRFRVELTSMQLCPDVDVELDVARLVLQEGREDKSVAFDAGSPTPSSGSLPPATAASTPYSGILAALRSRAGNVDSGPALDSFNGDLICSTLESTRLSAAAPDTHSSSDLPASPLPAKSTSTSVPSTTSNAHAAVDDSTARASQFTRSHPIPSPHIVGTGQDGFDDSSDDQMKRLRGRMQPSPVSPSGEDCVSRLHVGSSRSLLSAEVALERVRSALLATVLERLRGSDDANSGGRSSPRHSPASWPGLSPSSPSGPVIGVNGPVGQTPSREANTAASDASLRSRIPSRPSSTVLGRHQVAPVHRPAACPHLLQPPPIRETTCPAPLSPLQPRSCVSHTPCPLPHQLRFPPGPLPSTCSNAYLSTPGLPAQPMTLPDPGFFRATGFHLQTLLRNILVSCSPIPYHLFF
ncbi:hypothetical protein CF319_g635 [Tilletia indica]|nr:hypothetical protein CF319_g635 [Tilletia indica]